MFPLDNQLYNLSYYYNLNIEVKVFHAIGIGWGPGINGIQQCGHIKCDFVTSHDLNFLTSQSKSINYNNNILSVALYNLHSFGGEAHTKSCRPLANLTLADSEESFISCGNSCSDLTSNRHIYDGFVTVHPWADIPRLYAEAHLNPSRFLPLIPYSNLLKAASFISSNCHDHDSTNSARTKTIPILRDLGLRIDGLGKCLHSIGPGGVELVGSNLWGAMNKYMFNIGTYMCSVSLRFVCSVYTCTCVIQNIDNIYVCILILSVVEYTI